LKAPLGTRSDGGNQGRSQPALLVFRTMTSVMLIMPKRKAGRKGDGFMRAWVYAVNRIFHAKTQRNRKERQEERIIE
jgi:hypothetical protein